VLPARNPTSLPRSNTPVGGVNYIGRAWRKIGDFVVAVADASSPRSECHQVSLRGRESGSGQTRHAFGAAKHGAGSTRSVRNRKVGGVTATAWRTGLCPVFEVSCWGKPWIRSRLPSLPSDPCAALGQPPALNRSRAVARPQTSPARRHRSSAPQADAVEPAASTPVKAALTR